jgi:hypothetical protein
MTSENVWATGVSEGFDITAAFWISHHPVHTVVRDERTSNCSLGADVTILLKRE